MRVLRWLHRRDADLWALRRTGRTALIMPALFALFVELAGDPTAAIFAAFGSLATLLFVDFGGPMRERLVAQASLVLAGAVLVSLGTLASQTVWSAAVSTLVVGFVLLFTAIIGSVIASATTSLVISFILPVTLRAPLSSLPDRLVGWSVAGAVSLVAIRVLWPAPLREPLRDSSARACFLLARRLRGEVDCAIHGGASQRARTKQAIAESSATVASLRGSFFGTPYRPTCPGGGTRALVHVIDQLVWLDAVLERMPFEEQTESTSPVVCRVKSAAATLLEHGALLLGTTTSGPADLTADLARLRDARQAMESAVVSALPARRGTAPATLASEPAAELVSSLEPSFRAQEMSVAITAIATNIELSTMARGRSLWQRLMVGRPMGVDSPLSLAGYRVGVHLERHSVWLHNSVRGAIALALAVLIAGLTGVQHSFWVVFGTLAVLRSNALNTGQSTVRALVGTAVGIVIGGGIVVAVGANTVVFWLLLPVAVVFGGLAPAVISFAAGQAGFTIVLLFLFNLIAPAGWKIGLVRFEDVALGCAVSLVVGALFWPRGAASALGQSLAEALSDSVRYLRAAVEFGLSRCDALVPTTASPVGEARHAAAAAGRLDDAFRGFLTERGTKHLRLADVATLITGVAVIRLTADAVLRLWRRGDSSTGDRTAARAEILAGLGSLVDWYEQVAGALAGSGTVPRPVSRDVAADRRLLDAVSQDLSGEGGEGTATAVKVVWTADHLDVARRLQPSLRGPAIAASAGRRSRRRARRPP